MSRFIFTFILFRAGAIWSLALRPDGRGFMTASADKYVKFWDFTIGTGTIAFSLSRQLEMTHDALCAVYRSSMISNLTTESFIRDFESFLSHLVLEKIDLR